MRSYQSVLILKPDFDEAQVGETLEKITELVKSHGGAILKVDKWGKKRLAYKVKKNRFGYYLNIYHTCENEKVSSLEAKFKLYDAIIKFMVLRLDDKELERAMGNGEEPEEGKVSAEAKPKSKQEDEPVKAEVEEEATVSAEAKPKSKQEDEPVKAEVESVKEVSVGDEKKEGGE